MASTAIRAKGCGKGKKGHSQPPAVSDRGCRGGGIKPEDLRRRWASIQEPAEVVEFYGHGARAGKYCCFSNFFWEEFEFVLPEDFLPDGASKFAPVVKCKYSEKAIMLCKAALMDDGQTYGLIARSSKPAESKALGRKVRGFRDDLWQDKVCAVAFETVYQKFSQSPALQQILLSTGDAIIAEATTRDANWGIGLDVGDPKVQIPAQWLGTNILGWALMEARDAIRSQLRVDSSSVGNMIIDLSLEDGAPSASSAPSAPDAPAKRKRWAKAKAV